MLWNLGLALAPLLLAMLLFVPSRRIGPAWWAGVVAFVALLPNAPYVLTDVVHFTDAVRATDDDLHVAFVLIPVYSAFFFIGFGCYVASVVRLERWLRSEGWSLPRLLGVDLTLHALCAVGVFIGRVFRFNSWDLVARPGEVASVVRIPEPRSVALVLLTFVVLAGGSAAARLGVGIRVRRPAAQ